MSFLMALAAFAAIVTVYSTVVTVLVEGLHKLFGFRSAGMNEMLRAFYDENLSGIAEKHKLASGENDDDDAEDFSRNGAAFADRITKRAPAQNLRFWYLRSWPIIRSFFSSRRKSLTTLQFIEGLAETPEGRQLAKQSPEGLRASLRTVAYEFERLGEAQSAYFRSRANILSVLVGMAIAVFVNFDAIAAYKELSRNSELSARLTLTAQQDFAAGFRAEAAGSGADTDNTIILNDEMKKAAGNMRNLGIPTGRKMFPHCEGYAHTSQAPTETGETQEALANTNYIDARCGKKRQQDVNRVWATSFSEYLQRRGAESPGLLGTPYYWLEYRAGRVAAVGNNMQTFLLWLLGILVAGGLMGMGAPFWFRVFTRLSTITMPAAQVTLSQAASAKQKTTAATVAEEGHDVRPTGTSNPEILERAYLTVLSKKVFWKGLTGRRVKASVF